MLIIATLSGLAAVLSIFESMLPILPAVPGGKLGVANSVAVIVLYTFGAVPALAVNLIRVTVACMIYGGVNSFMYSFSGALVSTVVMICAKKVLKEKISPVGISVSGAACHNAAQVAVAWMILRTSALTWYLAALLIISLVSGTVCGWISSECIQRIRIKD